MAEKIRFTTRRIAALTCPPGKDRVAIFDTERTAELLREIAGRRAVVVVEHDMAFVSSLGCKVTVMHEGRVLVEGPMDEVAADPRVKEVYLGGRPC